MARRVSSRAGAYAFASGSEALEALEAMLDTNVEASEAPALSLTGRERSAEQAWKQAEDDAKSAAGQLSREPRRRGAREFGVVRRNTNTHTHTHTQRHPPFFPAVAAGTHLGARARRTRFCERRAGSTRRTCTRSARGTSPD